MKKRIKFELSIILFALFIGLLDSCKEKGSAELKDEVISSEKVISIAEKNKKKITPDFKKYWYSGNAEITSYTLEQARYGELRKGSSVLIYVTEPFLADKQIKADDKHANNIPVLKLNATKKYLTGIYPYTIMTSSFYPVHDNTHALKISFSAQEWCGHVYAQLNNRNSYEISSHSYFESEGDQNLSINKNDLENEVWNKIRINPSGLTTGNIQMIPSFEFLRLSHKELKAYDAIAKLTSDNNGNITYTIEYPSLKRTLAITFTETFPYTIENWSETYESGFGKNTKKLTTTGIKNKRIITPYWQQNKNSDLFLRDSLGL